MCIGDEGRQAADSGQADHLGAIGGCLYPIFVGAPDRPDRAWPVRSSGSLGPRVSVMKA